MQFTGPAKRWVQSVTEKLKTMKWSEFCSALHKRFDRDQHEFLLRQLNRICQTTSVQDYVDRFSELVDQLIAYDSSTNALFYITRFVDGLHSDIRAVILVQRPDFLDTAYTLALLQEEAAEASKKREFRQWNPRGGSQAVPQPRGDRSGQAESEKPLSAQKTLDKKLVDLKAYRRSCGLCDHCGKKWNREHKCAPQVGLNVLEELYALFSSEAADCTDPPEDSTEHVCLCLSAHAALVMPSVKTLQF